MDATDIKQRLHRFIETAEERRLKAIYTLLEDEIEQDEWEYTDEFKTELDRRYQDYRNGGATVTPQDADKQIDDLIAQVKG